jgi:hypothetical protein
MPDIDQEALAWSKYPIHLDKAMTGFSFLNGKIMSTVSVECYKEIMKTYPPASPAPEPARANKPMTSNVS